MQRDNPPLVKRQNREVVSLEAEVTTMSHLLRERRQHSVDPITTVDEGVHLSHLLHVALLQKLARDRQEHR